MAIATIKPIVYGTQGRVLSAVNHQAHACQGQKAQAPSKRAKVQSLVDARLETEARQSLDTTVTGASLASEALGLTSRMNYDGLAVARARLHRVHHGNSRSWLLSERAAGGHGRARNVPDTRVFSFTFSCGRGYDHVKAAVRAVLARRTRRQDSHVIAAAAPQARP